MSEALADLELRDQAAEAIRALVDEVVLEPGDKRGEVNATLRGEVMNILDLVSGQSPKPAPSYNKRRHRSGTLFGALLPPTALSLRTGKSCSNPSTMA